ncbi:MAG: hypothetical protein ACREH6_06290 [Geminicoccaceae bacterium]
MTIRGRSGLQPGRATRKAAIAALGLLAGACAGGSEVDEGRIDAMSDVDLARSYLDARYALETLAHVHGGAGISLLAPDGTTKVTPENVDQVGSEYRAWLDAYGRAMTQRGHAQVDGAYRLSASGACERVRSGLALSAAADRPDVAVSPAVVLIQRGPDVRLTQEITTEGDTSRIQYSGIVVHDALALQDAADPEFIFLGEARDGRIELRPDVRGQRATPKPDWVPEPDWQAASSCVITLEPETP